jgi:hypothetical protein
MFLWAEDCINPQVILLFCVRSEVIMRLLQFDFSEADVPRRSVFWLGRTVRGELDLLRRAVLEI